MIPDTFHTIDTISQHILPILEKQLMYSSILFGLILLATYLLRKRSTYWHIGLWSLFLLRLLLPPDLAHQWSAGNLLGRLIDPQQTVTQTLESFGLMDEGGSQPATMFVETVTQQKSNTSDTTRTQPFSDTFTRMSWVRIILFLAWIAGSMLVAIRYGWQLYKHARIVANAPPVKNAVLQSNLRELRAKVGVTRTIRLVSSSECAAAFTIGVMRPAIFLPQCLLDADAHADIEPILAHELMHVKRHDMLRSFLHNLLQALYFFNPCVWYAVHRLHLAQECICDQQAVNRCRIAPKTYAHSLLRAVELRIVPSERSVLPAFNDWKQAIAYRIIHIQGGRTMRSSQRFMIFALMLALGIFVLPMANSTIQASNPVQKEKSSQPLRTGQEKVSFKSPISFKSTDMRFDQSTQEMLLIGEAEVFWQSHIMQAGKMSVTRDLNSDRVLMIAMHGPGLIRLHNTMNVEGTDLIIEPFPDDGLSETDNMRIHSSEGLRLVTGSITLIGGNIDYLAAEKSVLATGVDEKNVRVEDRDEGQALEGSTIRLFWETDTFEAEGNVSISDLGQESPTPAFVAPLYEGYISAPFGPMIHPYTKKEIQHEGIDIAVKIGTEVYAVADGIVLSIPEGDAGYGKNLIIQHADGYTSRYCKLNEILVQEGQRVKAGEKIALSGNTGVSTGPHLHFELQHYDSHQNPEDLIDFSFLPRANSLHLDKESTELPDDKAQPVVVATSPKHGEVLYVPKEGLEYVFSVTYDQPMRRPGYSWVTMRETGAYPERIAGEKPTWTRDGKTCRLKMKIYPNTAYAISFNLEGKYENFRSTNGTPAEPYLLEFTALISPDSKSYDNHKATVLPDDKARPVVVATSPKHGEVLHVPKEGLEYVFSVTFDQPMHRGYAWVAGDDIGEYPEQIPGEKPTWTEDGKTCQLKMKIYPNTSYGILFNLGGKHESFRSVNGTPAKPYLLQFTT
jgi:murein DD-endopeptidase MepM/ murein hydrolase activator NlpD/beta-lactamase regulating signal transducer with metallopeptidase domain